MQQEYKILYKSENAWQFIESETDGFPTLDDAVKYFLDSWANMYPFKIVKVIEWEAKESKE